METVSSLSHVQEPATCPYPEPSQSSPCTQPIFWRSILILPSHLRLGLQSGLFPSSLPIRTIYVSLLSPICATCPTHLIDPWFDYQNNFSLTTTIIYFRIIIIVQKASYFLNCADVARTFPHYCSRIHALVLNRALSGSLVSAGFNRVTVMCQSRQ